MKWSKVVNRVPSTPQPIAGDVASSNKIIGGALPEDPFESLISTPPSSDTSATADTVADVPLTPLASQKSSTLAPSTLLRGVSSTVWSTSPVGFVESGSQMSIDDLNGLPDLLRERLLSLAKGMSEPVESVVQQIAEFFVVEEDERAEGTLLDALTFYLENYFIEEHIRA